jgi:hypothetical protein
MAGVSHDSLMFCFLPQPQSVDPPRLPLSALMALSTNVLQSLRRDSKRGASLPVVYGRPDARMDAGLEPGHSSRTFGLLMIWDDLASERSMAANACHPRFCSQHRN